MSSQSLRLTSSQNWSAGNQYESSPQPWRSGRNQYGSSHDDEYGPTRPHYVVPATLRYEPEGGTFAPWRLFEERVRTGPYGLTGFPSEPYSPFRILVLSPGTQQRVNPSLSQFIRDSSPEIRTDWNLRGAFEPELPGLTDDEFKKAMRLLKKDIYSPTTSPKKKRPWPRGFFSAKSSNTDISITRIKSDEEKEEKKRNETKSCTICLEDFVSNEQVLVTPCNHMFHKDCLEPWVKSHGKCPVCRFGFLERIQRSERVSSLSNDSYNNNRRLYQDNNHNNNGMVSRGNNSDAVDLVYLIRAMEEALNWLTVPR